MSRRFTRLEGFVPSDAKVTHAVVEPASGDFRFEPLFDEVDLLLRHSSAEVEETEPLVHSGEVPSESIEAPDETVADTEAKPRRRWFRRGR